MERNPDSHEPRHLLAALLLKSNGRGALQEALGLAEQAWAMSGGDPRVGQTLVRAYVANGKTALGEALAVQLGRLGRPGAAG